MFALLRKDQPLLLYKVEEYFDLFIRFHSKKKQKERNKVTKINPKTLYEIF